MKEKQILRVFLKNAHHTRNYYITAPNAFSMEGLTLINGVNSIFHNLCDSKLKCDLKLLIFFWFCFISIKTVTCVLSACA